MRRRSVLPWLWSLAFWLGFGTLLGLHEHAVWMADRPLWPALAWQVLGQWGPFIPLTPPLFAAGAALARRADRRRLPFLLACAGALLTATFLHLTIRSLLWRALPIEGDAAERRARMSWAAAWLQEEVRGFPWQLLQYVAVLGVAVGLAERRAAEARAREEAELRRRLGEAQLEALRGRLQPHFLFNTLHAVGVVARTDPEACSRMLTLLGDLLRSALDERRGPLVPLRQELDLLGRYLDLQRIRFSDRLSVTVDVPADLMDAEVPDLSLQPLVENALRHGIERRAGAGTVRVEARRTGDALEVRVLDDGPGPDGGGTREGIGLSNTRARIEALFGAAGALTLAPAEGGGTEALLRVPLRSADGGARA